MIKGEGVARIRMLAEQMQIRTPHTFNVLERMVMTIADTVKNEDKKTLLGRDKGIQSYSRFLSVLNPTIHAMVLDGVIKEASPTDDVLTEFEHRLRKFSMAFPNWKDADGFVGTFLGECAPDSVPTTDRLRSTSYTGTMC
ncbi:MULTISPECIES: hypothetical protein [Paraburkholderia]|uniref:hypothetical protein n=1 Tax=Paraburkholderia TaxID=1822464 RepID=UPI0038B75BD7